MSEAADRRGSLVVVGSGIRILGQLTVEAIARVKGAEKVFLLVSDPIAAAILERLNPGRSESLLGFYGDGKPRIETYHEMVGHVLESVRAGLGVCLVSYGHPGIFAFPTHEAVRQARAEGYDALMLPAISAEDCLFADLGLDPASTGCVSFEATDFLIRRYRYDPACLVILWQIGVIGVLDKPSQEPQVFGLPLLVERLSESYPLDHPVTIYQATIVLGQTCFAKTVPLRELAATEIPPMSTLCIKPAVQAAPDREMASRLERLRDEARAS